MYTAWIKNLITSLLSQYPLGKTLNKQSAKQKYDNYKKKNKDRFNFN